MENKPNIKPGSFIPDGGITIDPKPTPKIVDTIKTAQAPMTRHQRRTFKALMRREARRQARKKARAIIGVKYRAQK